MNFNNFNTSVIIEFNPKCDPSIKQWLNSKITAPKEKNGAELLTQFSSNSNNEVIK